MIIKRKYFDIISIVLLLFSTIVLSKSSNENDVIEIQDEVVEMLFDESNDNENNQKSIIQNQINKQLNEKEITINLNVDFSISRNENKENIEDIKNNIKHLMNEIEKEILNEIDETRETNNKQNKPRSKAKQLTFKDITILFVKKVRNFFRTVSRDFNVPIEYVAIVCSLVFSLIVCIIAILSLKCVLNNYWNPNNNDQTDFNVNENNILQRIMKN